MKFSEFNENKKHGRDDFPIQLYAVTAAHPDYVMQLHRHKEFEIVRVERGVLHLYIHNVRHELRAGDTAFINCHDLHRADPVDCAYECAVCDLSFLTRKGNDRCSALIHPIVAGELTAETRPLLSRGAEESLDTLFTALREEKPYHELVAAGALLSLFAFLYEAGKITDAIASKGIQSGERTITALLGWIDRHYAERFTLTTLSDAAGVTPNYLCRIFKEYTGKTPTEYANAVRVEHVCHELRWGQKNVTEAALSCGFNDISYFCKVFKKQKGVSAKAYLKENGTK